MYMNLISNPNHHLDSNTGAKHTEIVILISTCFLFFNCRMLNVYCINSYEIHNKTSTVLKKATERTIPPTKKEPNQTKYSFPSCTIPGVLSSS